MKKSIIISFMIICSFCNLFSQNDTNLYYSSYREHSIYTSFSNVSLFNNGLSNDMQFSIRYSSLTPFSKYLFTEFGLSSIFSPDYSFGLIVNIGINLNILKQLRFRPFVGGDVQYTTKSNYILIGTNFDYVIQSSNDYFGAYIIGFNIRYPILRSISNDKNLDLYNKNVPIIEFKIGIGL